LKLLLDENLSPLLAQRLADLYPESSHVEFCGLLSAEDSEYGISHANRAL
jgi:predicted nuclease of predicted toxin-antitoxin system